MMNNSQVVYMHMSVKSNMLDKVNALTSSPTQLQPEGLKSID